MCQAIVKFFSAMCCFAVIISEFSALIGILMAIRIVMSTNLKDPIVSELISLLLLIFTIVDLVTQVIGLIYAIYMEQKWPLRMYMVIMVACFITKCTIVMRSPVSTMKTAPFLGRDWSYSNTLKDQMEQDIKRYPKRLPVQKRSSSLYHFEETLHCCGVRGRGDYNSTESLACYGGRRPPAPPTTIAPATTTFFINITLPPGPDPLWNATVSNTTEAGGTGRMSADEAAPGAIQPYSPGCESRVTYVFEGSRITFDATCSSLFWEFFCIVLTIGWSECWGDGLLTGLTCCKDEEEDGNRRPPPPSIRD